MTPEQWREKWHTALDQAGMALPQKNRTWMTPLPSAAYLAKTAEVLPTWGRLTPEPGETWEQLSDRKRREMLVQDMQESVQAARADDLVQMREALKVATTNAEQATKHAMHLEAENKALRERVAEMERLIDGRPRTFKHIEVSR